MSPKNTRVIPNQETPLLHKEIPSNTDINNNSSNTINVVPVTIESVKFSWKHFVKFCGPGIIMSLAYVDPGNIEADLQSGSFTNYQLLWVLCLAHAVGCLLQILSVRLGVASSNSLPENCRSFYSTKLNIFLWLMTEIAIIGSDVQEVLGSAIGLQVLFGIPLWLGCLITAFDTVTFLMIHVYRGTRVVEFIVLFFVGIMCACFFLNVEFTPHINKVEFVEGLFIPSVSSYAIVQMVGVVGAVIMPHNLHLHSALVQSRSVSLINEDRRVYNHNEDLSLSSQSSTECSIQDRMIDNTGIGDTIDDTHEVAVKSVTISYFGVDSILSLFISLCINVAILVSFASSFFSEKCAENPSTPLGCIPEGDVMGNTDCVLSDCSCHTPNGVLGQCASIGLANAPLALSNLFTSSSAATILFAIGLLAAGQASTLANSFAGQYVMEGFLKLKIPIYLRLIITRSIAILPALFIAITHTNISKMNTMNSWLNILQSIQLPFAILPLLKFNNNTSIMSSAFKLSHRFFLAIVILAGIIILTNFYLVYDQIRSNLEYSFELVVLCVTVGVIYLGALYTIWIH